MKLRRIVLGGWAASVMLGVHLVMGAEVLEPARSLPVAHEVDVVVVGGSAAGVAAAVEAARNGAKVFLAAPRPYLGEDICGTYRLWLEPGEVPTTDLARAVLISSSTNAATAPRGPGLPFTYTADKKSSPKHADSNPPAKLADGQYASAPAQSVQYDENVKLLVDLGKAQPVKRVNLMAYQRPAEFAIARVKVSAGVDKDTLKPVTTITNEVEGGHEGAAFPLTATLDGSVRFIQLEVQMTAESSRILVGEILVESAETQPQIAAPTAAPAPKLVTPMQVKRTLDDALIKAGVPFLYSSYISDVLTDANGYPAGVVIVNRSGRQAVLAKVIIDATERATVARLAGAVFSPFPAGNYTFDRVVVGAKPRSSPDLELRQRAVPLTVTDRQGNVLPVHEYRLKARMKDDTFGSFAAANQLARDLTWTPECVDSSEEMFLVPPDVMRGKLTFDQPWPGAEKLPLEPFRPAGMDQVFVTGGCADLSREVAAAVARPVNAMALGARVGEAAARQAKAMRAPEGVKLAAKPVAGAVKGEVREVSPDANHRLAGARRIPAAARGLPVLAEYDVIVVGGGTGGAPAAIAAGRQRARTLLLEYIHMLGGVGTAGLISSYYHGNRVGFTSEIDKGLLAYGPADTRVSSSSWNPDWKSEWYRSQARLAGVDIWYGTLGAGAIVDRGRVIGMVVATPHGRYAVLAKAVVDATGNADVAAAAGAECRYTSESEMAVQGTGLPPRELGSRYTNTDYSFVDDTDIVDIWRMFVTARQKFRGAYDLGQLIDTRERRQIVGDAFLTPMDMILLRTYPDTVVIAKSNFDTHGYTVHPIFTLRPPHRDDIAVHVPYRCLLPKGLDGVIVTGLGVSAHRDALPCIRMQADVQNQGYAAGVAAAMIAKKGCTMRELDLKALQKHLVAKGNLPESVLTDKDSFPPSAEKVTAAINNVVQDYTDLEYLLVDPDAAKPQLKAALRKALNETNRLVYAHILAMLGDSSGAEVLAKTIAATAWDKGWRYTGMGQFGASMSPLDSYIIALGRTGDQRGLAAVIEKTRKLDDKSEFSHFRAVALAFEAYSDPAAAPALAELLQKPGISGHAHSKIETALENNPRSGTDVEVRNKVLKELVMARALYRCGDHQGVGEKILRQYAQDLHGHYSRHAAAVLKEKAKTSAK